jgi:nitrite reductase (NO-forming)
MARARRLIAASIIVAISLTVIGCSAAATPDWTFTPGTGAPPADAVGADRPHGTPGTARPALAGDLEVEAFDLGFRPASLSVPAPGVYRVTFTNTGSTLHDLTFSDGTRLVADPGRTTTADVDVPEGGLAYECTVPGHAPAGMTGQLVVGDGSVASGTTTGSATSSDATATPAADPAAPPYELRDPAAPALASGTVHDVDFPIIETDVTVADGFVVHAWTFGGTVPGPVIRVKVGDTVNVHLTNQGSMSHSIDFHASETAWNHQMVDIQPGETFTYTFRANYAGVWMYHCGTAPTLHHIANGMFGMVIVEPKAGLPPVDQEFAFVQGEWYLGAQREPADYAKASASAPSPDFVAFNGVANQYKDHPVQVEAGQPVRVFVLDAGPNVDSSFHVVGTIFDNVIKEGDGVTRGNAGHWGSQAVDLSPAQGAIIEFTPAEDGLYPFVTHAFNFVGHGAVGLFQAGDGDPLN